MSWTAVVSRKRKRSRVSVCEMVAMESSTCVSLIKVIRASLGTLCHSRCFFSSRRRHTRFDCDWSSDVCSSDLHDGHAGGKYGPQPTRMIPVMMRIDDQAHGLGGESGAQCVEHCLHTHRAERRLDQDRKSVV